MEDLTLVIHDWGSALGFHYAHRNAGNVRAIAFMEALIRPVKWSEFPPGFKVGFKLMRTPGIGWLMISGLNMFVNKILPSAIVRDLTEAEMRHYREPYPTTRSRRPLRQWPCEIPIDGTPADVHEVVDSYSKWLGETDIPMILFYGSPGGIIQKSGLDWCTSTIENLDVVDVGPGIHFLQEDNPHLIGAKLAEWLDKLA